MLIGRGEEIPENINASQCQPRENSVAAKVGASRSPQEQAPGQSTSCSSMARSAKTVPATRGCQGPEDSERARRRDRFADRSVMDYRVTDSFREDRFEGSSMMGCSMAGISPSSDRPPPLTLPRLICT